MAGDRQPSGEFFSVKRRCGKVHRCVNVNPLSAPFCDVFDGVVGVGGRCHASRLPSILTHGDTQREVAEGTSQT